MKLARTAAAAAIKLRLSRAHVARPGEKERERERFEISMGRIKKFAWPAKRYSLSFFAVRKDVRWRSPFVLYYHIAMNAHAPILILSAVFAVYNAIMRLVK